MSIFSGIRKAALSLAQKPAQAIYGAAAKVPGMSSQGLTAKEGTRLSSLLNDLLGTKHAIARLELFFRNDPEKLIALSVANRYLEYIESITHPVAEVIIEEGFHFRELMLLDFARTALIESRSGNTPFSSPGALATLSIVMAQRASSFLLEAGLYAPSNGDIETASRTEDFLRTIYPSRADSLKLTRAERVYLVWKVPSQGPAN